MIVALAVRGNDHARLRCFLRIGRTNRIDRIVLRRKGGDGQDGNRQKREQSHLKRKQYIHTQSVPWKNRKSNGLARIGMAETDKEIIQIMVSEQNC